MPTQFEEMTVAELKEALKERGLVRSGNKSELIQRLVENETPNTNESTEGNVEFDCPNCRSRLQVPASFEGSIICPNLFNKIDNALAKKQQSLGFTMTQNQISLAVSISGLVLGLVAIIVFFSAFTADAMCPKRTEIPSLSMEKKLGLVTLVNSCGRPKQPRVCFILVA